MRMNVTMILKSKGRDVTTSPVDTTVEAVAQQLAARNIGAVVVVNPDQSIAGIISERDIIRAIAQHGCDALALPVTRVMTKEVWTCSGGDTLVEIMEKMTAYRSRHVPVIENEELAGIVSIGDIVKNHIAEVEMEASSLKSYIVA
jgi:CBS domain-containing protein